MPWNSFLLIPTLFGIICCNRIVDTRLRKSYYSVDNEQDSVLSTIDSLSNVYGNPNIMKDVNLDDSFDTNYPYNSFEDKFRSKLYDTSEECNQCDTPKEDGQLEKKKFNLSSYKRDGNVLIPLWNPSSPILRLVRRNEGEDDVAPTESNDMESINARDDMFKMSMGLSNDFYSDLLYDANKEDVKRGSNIAVIGCDCKIKNSLIDLGHEHFPRYLLNAVCQSQKSKKCRRGSYCKPLEYRVKVLTFRALHEHGVEKDIPMPWLSDDAWKFKTVTVAAGCFCAY